MNEMPFGARSFGGDPLRGFSTRSTPQSEPIPGSNQIQNNAGGYAFAIDDWTRLTRFLVLGTDGGTYYVNQRQLTRANAECVARCLDVDPIRTIDTIVAVSEAGRAPKNDQALFALAMATAHTDPRARAYALAALPRVARIGTHLYHFAAYMEQFRGWGRANRRAIGDWFTSREPGDLAYQIVKYRQRDGWSARDLLRLAHPKAPSPEHAEIFDFVCGRRDGDDTGIRVLEGFARIQAATNDKEVARLLTEYHLPWEVVPDAFRTAATWDALLNDNMPMEAMIRNLPTMTRLGVLAPLSANARLVSERLADDEALRRARIHPIKVLVALRTYASGRSMRGDGAWTPVGQIVDALDGAFYKAFGNVTPAGGNFLLALDVSGSMSWGNCAGAPITPREGSAAMSLVTHAVEQNVQTMGFSDKLVPINISPRQRLDDVIRTVSQIEMGRTDCALPMYWAADSKVEVDHFVVLTDNETWAGRRGHPVQALREYREKSGRNARLVVVGMTATEISIADPNDAGTLDVTGFDTAAPELISSFCRGEL